MHYPLLHAKPPAPARQQRLLDALCAAHRRAAAAAPQTPARPMAARLAKRRYSCADLRSLPHSVSNQLSISISVFDQVGFCQTIASYFKVRHAAVRYVCHRIATSTTHRIEHPSVHRF
jgi:hypothetical protein